MKVKVKNVWNGQLALKPNVGQDGGRITLTSGKSHTFKSEDDYAKYAGCCSSFVEANRLKVEMVEDKKKVESAEESGESKPVEAATPAAEKPAPAKKKKKASKKVAKKVSKKTTKKKPSGRRRTKKS